MLETKLQNDIDANIKKFMNTNGNAVPPYLGSIKPITLEQRAKWIDLLGGINQKPNTHLIESALLCVYRAKGISTELVKHPFYNKQLLKEFDDIINLLNQFVEQKDAI